MGNTYKLIELVGTSDQSFSEAVQNAISEASRTVKGLSWFEVVEQRGRITDNRVEEYQVKLRVGFRILHND